jgi:hypothetical protein
MDRSGFGRTAALRGLWLALAALALLAPAILIGAPSQLDDTDVYFDFGLFVWEKLGIVFADNNEIIGLMDLAGARSMTFSIVFTPIIEVFGIWGLPVLHALMTAGIVQIAARALRIRNSGAAAAAACLAIGLLSPGGLVVAYLMPDILAGLAVAAVLILVLFGTRLGRLEWLYLLGLSVYGVTAHGSNAPVLAAATVACVIALALARRLDRAALMRAGIVAASIVVGVGVGVGLLAKTERIVGAHATSPPFLSARLLADGPGRAYLRAVCPQADFLLCKHAAKPLDDSQRILWGGEEDGGVFIVSPPLERRALYAEQGRFVAGVLAYDPLGVVLAASGNALRQLATFGMSDDYSMGICGALHSPSWLEYDIHDVLIAGGLKGYGTDMGSCRALPHWAIASVIERAGVVLAAIGLAAYLVRRRAWRLEAASEQTGQEDRDLLLFAAALAVALLANAAVCGAISGAFGRYQARIVWLVVMTAAFAAARLIADRRKEPTR